jgi:IS1 family transposase
VRSIERTTGTHRDTILNVLVLVGNRCERLLERVVHRVPVKNVGTDEIWTYVGCHEKRNAWGNPRFGDRYCFVAIERDSELILCWQVGKRTAPDTQEFIDKLDEATAGTFQLSTDGYGPYFDAIHTVLAHRVEYGQIIKSYGTEDHDDHRYSPPQVVDITIRRMWGNPDPEKICTSYVERQNLTLCMSMRRLTRLTNAYSRKWENLRAAYALQFAYYNLCRVHQTLRCTPAMESKITNHVWELRELLA